MKTKKPDFVWQEADDTLEEVTVRADPRSPRWRLLAIILVLLIASLALVAQYQRQRIQRQEDAIRAEIVASFQLWHQAVLRNDLELFLFQLADGHSEWKESQEQLFQQHRLLDRPAFGLKYDPGVGAPEVTAVDLAPDWETAVLSVRYPYILDESRHSALLYLQASYRFERQDTRWLLAAPLEDFWGAGQTLQRAGLTVLYPQRDAQVVRRLADDLMEDLQGLCRELRSGDDACPQAAAVQIRFATDPVVLAALHDRLGPVFRAGGFLLPAPTLVGLPQDEAAYQALYDGYSRRILQTVAANLRPVASPPQQDLALLCFPEQGQPLRLFRYEVASDRWTNELPEQQFRSLMRVPSGNGIILQGLPSSDEANRLRLTYWQGEREKLLLDRVVSDQLKRPAGWASSAQPRLLLHGVEGNRSYEYHWLDLEQCGPSGCELVDLTGYTTWSAYGTHTLLLDGDDLWRGDHQGEPLVPLGTGLAPFWLNNEHYGYVRYDREAGAPSMQVVTATVGVDLPHIVLPVQALSERLNAQTPPLTFINHVVVNPGDSELLLLWTTTVGTFEGTRAIFSYRLSTGDLRLVAQFERLPKGDPSRLTPAGYPPFRLSPDGRWLLVTLLESLPATSWHFRLFDLKQHEELSLSISYDGYPTPFAIYDWTSDGRWLAIVEHGFLRLAAPGIDQERLIPYPFENCLFAAWIAAE